MFGWLGKLFGSDKVIEKGFDLIDSIHTSDVEEIEAKVKSKTDLLKAYAPFKLTQRVLAFAFTFVFLSCFIMVLFGIGIDDTTNVIDVLNQFYIGEIMLTITVFYFGGGFLEGAIHARNEGKGNGIIKQTK